MYRAYRPSMRRTAVALALAVPAAIALVASPAPAATAGKPAFHTVLLDGSSGSSEPRVTVAPGDIRFLTTNAKSGDEVVYRSVNGLTWRRTEAIPPDQTNPTTDVDVVSMHTGRVLTS